MTDDEISELAECLEDACQQSAVPVSRTGKGDCCCPFGAMAIWPRNPMAYVVARSTGLAVEDARAFIHGYDGLSRSRTDDPRLYALGKQFAERYP